MPNLITSKWLARKHTHTHYRVFAKQIKPLPTEAQLPDFYHPSEAQKSGEILFVAVGIDIATYALYKYFK